MITKSEVERALHCAADPNEALMMADNCQRIDDIAGVARARPGKATRLNTLLAEWWGSTDGVSSCRPRRIVSIFRRGGFVTDGPGVTLPTTPQTIYRGSMVAIQRRVIAAAYPRGMGYVED